MANVFNVARYILQRKGPMSTWKLQKLCYYSQAWAIAWTDHPLFEEDFEAWANGPVCFALFDRHRGKFTVSLEDIPASLESAPSLNEDERDTIDRVISHYGALQPYQLREQSHSEDPWKIARGDTPEGERSHAIITKDSMGAYYGSL